MKVNAPEKIYIDVSLDSAYGMAERSYDNEVEYIRADTFIKKACDAFCKVCKMPNCRRNECRLISDFEGHLQAYMKGK